MASKVSRRRFLASAATGTAVGVAATVAASADGSETPPLPLPDAETKGSVDGTGPEEECCTPASTVIFACSGAADVGKIADLSARKLTEDGVGKMSCLAGVGGRVKPLMEITKAAKVILAIDGCPLHCGRNTLEQAGFKKFEHLCLSDIGMVKGKTPVTDEAVVKAATLGRAKLPKLSMP
jgi:uncharacterized metal-binding protein